MLKAKTILLIELLLFASLSTSAENVFAQQFSQNTESIEARRIDRRTEILQAYLSQFNSPLKGQAGDFVEASQTYNLDWRLVAAIAGVESTFGKFIPGGPDPKFTSYNAWGWGVYGTQAIYFKSWREGIFTVSEGLRKNYLDKGLTDPYAINRIYAVSPTWGSKVSFFLEDMEKFADNYNKENPEVINPDFTIKIAASSGRTPSSPAVNAN